MFDKNKFPRLAKHIADGTVEIMDRVVGYAPEEKVYVHVGPEPIEDLAIVGNETAAETALKWYDKWLAMREWNGKNT